MPPLGPQGQRAHPGFARAAGFLLLALVLLPALAGCGGDQRFWNLEEELGQDLGKLSYSEAQVNWGPPTSVTQGRGVFTAYWLKESSGGLVKEHLYLTFDKHKELLRSYRYYKKPLQ
ncbi:MAG: hypothetical protein KQJ78_10520 [Deltaproteobacteria bacterium]|nr:hypothetical protein [Deltaproteobacteria bacterium]